VTYDILVHPGKISLTDLQAHCATIWAGEDQDRVQSQIRSKSVTQHLEADKEKWFFQHRGGKDSLIIFKLLMM
jgi:hypothetical protein